MVWVVVVTCGCARNKLTLHRDPMDSARKAHHHPHPRISIARICAGVDRYLDNMLKLLSILQQSSGELYVQP